MSAFLSGRPNHKLFSLLILLSLILGCGLPGPSAAPESSLEFTDHVLVSLTEPLDGEEYPVSAGLSVRAEAISDGSISRMELWADGELYARYNAPEDGLGLLAHSWMWSPKTLGVHTLMVRAYNDREQTAFSNTIRVKGILDPGFILITRAEDGDTVSSLAGRYSVPVDEVLRENPGLTETASLPAGTEITIPIGAPLTASAPSTTARVLMNLNEWTVNRRRDFPGLQTALAAPTLAISGQGCAATLSIGDSSDNEKGFNLYRLDPSAMSFSKLTTLPAHEGNGNLSYQDSNLYGRYHYYVAAFDDVSEEASNLVSLEVNDAGCAGEPTTIGDLAFIPMGVDRYYLYVAVNNGPWRRFPGNEFTYLKRSDEMDFGQVANALAPNLVGDVSMRGEVWSMVNGSATLLGTFDKSFKRNQAPASFEPFPVQMALSTILEVRGIPIVGTTKYNWHKEKGMNYDPQIFRFGTDTNAAYGFWQVSSVPFGSDVSFNPACLLLSGKANGSGTPSTPFQFNIDFAPLKPKIEAVKLSPFENSLDQTPIFSSPFSPAKYDASPQQTVMQPNWSAGAFGLSGDASAFVNFDPCAQNMSAEGVITYYVRVIPMNNGQAAGKPSNTVIMKYDPNGKIEISIPVVPLPTDIYYDVKILNFTGVHVPESGYEFCVVVVENKSSNIAWSYLKPGDVLCPKTDQGGSKSFLEELGDIVEGAFNFISDVYQKLSDWAVELVEQLNPLCIQAKMASSAIKVGEEEVKDACHYVAVIAVTAAKTYAGLPPSLPNFEQLKEMGKENLVDLAVQELESNGVPCPEECKDVIRKGIDASIEQMEKSMSNSSCSSEPEKHGYKKLCLPSDVITKPDPRGQPAPAILQVQVTRRPNTTGPDFPAPTSCRVVVSVYAKNDSHIGNEYGWSTGFEWTGAPIEGNVLAGAEAFPNLQPGKSSTFPVILSPFPFWLPGHQQFIQKGWKPEHWDDWNLLYQGAMATINAGGTCKFEFPEGTGFTDKVVNGDSLSTGPLGNAWPNTCHPYNCP
ncbi:MAG: LysM peptidoglycan-binding domain-containing protein [Anaerolineales bacterium]|nr:LysM peptidoglycan-binding domain-containing protein [Anaerolineales bacterium]NUQ86060.1 LysM peptidoglycan-binding domain-containing protein [Anaerolineales bacterium]